MKFTYNKQSTDDFNIFVASFDKIDELNSGLSREIIRSDFNTHNSIPKHLGVKYTTPIEFRGALIKKDESTFTTEEIRKINKWLTSPKTPKEMVVSDCHGNISNYLYKGLFTEIQYKIANGVVGIIFTFVNDSPFLYEIKEETLLLEYSEMGWCIYCDNDETYEYTYPKIEITYKGMNDTTKLTLTNNTDDKKSFSIDLLRENTVTIDCKNQLIKNKSGVLPVTTIINENNQIYWLRFADEYNDLVISSQDYPCEVKMTYYELRKIGELYEY
jgi:hypothetical protein